MVETLDVSRFPLEPLRREVNEDEQRDRHSRTRVAIRPRLDVRSTPGRFGGLRLPGVFAACGDATAEQRSQTLEKRKGADKPSS
jgi:hypothetical protein